ncbi:1,4-alpha-glucan branching protein [Streptomyces sp. ISL-66]|uniref:maltokinase N-terminal cap-like domain-containing protein n=1 Tax=Streptomyces sp. ISL-66 TaxID=2819186 RepID=UPI001BEADC30|nr:1,4-alpha-glucan branching protein [Streptomyces sp. ISL-66]MBT2470148.1 1,4-alpha-glucan branching protein [Streptomyces sp. ISL-66]
MAMIYKTTMTPGKLELVTAWLPTRPWYVATGHAPDLARSGGFRLDDPEGEVGIEFMVLTDTSGGRETSYHVPLTYRGAPLDGAGDAAGAGGAGSAGAGLVGTSEHGVLGTRWIYDGAHDPVLVSQLLELLRGRATAQHQTESDTPDPGVTAWFGGAELLEALSPEPLEVSHTARGTDVLVAGSRAVLTVTRVLRARDEVTDADADVDADAQDGPSDPPASRALGRVTAAWTTPEGAAHRGTFATLHAAAGRPASPRTTA